MWLSSLTDQQRHTLMRLAHNVVVSDGLLDPNEEGMLNEFRLEMELARDAEFEYMELDGIDKIFATRRSRFVAILNLLKLSYADGAFEIEEECLLKEICQSFAIKDDEFLLLDNWVKRLTVLETEALDLIDG